jgi:parvulin-like peptidyl-prolyl isomerase
MSWSIRLPIVAGIMGLAVALGGCNDKDPGPKRADDKEAHAHRYHPAVTRDTGGAPLTRPAETAPAEPSYNPAATPGPVGSPVMFVNADCITIPEILEPILDELTKESRALSERDYGESVIRLVRNQIDFQVSTLVVYQRAKNKYSDKKIQEAFDKEVDRRVQDIINDRFGGVFARYEAHLKALDFTLSDMKDRVKRQIMVQEFLREQLRPMLQEPPRRELFKYYQAHLAEFTTPEKAELLLIEIPLAEELGKSPALASASELAAARQKARGRLARAREELESGIDFATVAKAYSRGALASEGGAWGEVSRGALAKRWAKPGEVLFTLKPGQVSDIVDTDESLFLVKCGKRTPAHQTSFEESQRKVVDRMLEEQFVRQRTDYIRNLLESATIRKDREFLAAVLAAVPKPVHTDEKGGPAAGRP